METSTETTHSASLSDGGNNKLHTSMDSLNLSSSADAQKYKLIKVIGKGTYSTVYLSQSSEIKRKRKSSQRMTLPIVFEEADDEDVVSQISEILQNSTSQKQLVEDYQDDEPIQQALKIIQRPNFQKFDQTYYDQKTIFMNDAMVLQAIQGHPNIVNLVEVIDEGIVETQDQKLHVDYAMVIECIKGGELYYNMEKFGRYDPNLAHYFFCQILDAVSHMHSRGYCHRDLKPWNIMLSEDYADAKVIDFSYSTPLDHEAFQKSPEILKGFLSGTRYFMAPEQLNEERYPIMDDFSKIDVWALGVLLINMLTLDFAFPRADDQKLQEFLEDPSRFFESHDVKFNCQQELDDVSDLLRKMLEFDVNKRISVFEAMESNYVTKYHHYTFKHDLQNNYNFQSHPQLSREQVKFVMKQRLSIDQTLAVKQQFINESMNTNVSLNDMQSSTQQLPEYLHFCWNSTIIKHSIVSLHEILQMYQKTLDQLFFSIFRQNNAELMFRITKKENTKADNLYVAQLDIPSNMVIQNDVLRLKKMMQANLVFTRDENGAIVCEILRRTGDYLTFIKFYVSVWQSFNSM